MFAIGHERGPYPKCYFTHSILPAFVNHDQPPQKKKPFSTIQYYPFTHTLDLLLPKDAHDTFLDKLNGEGTLQYSKVYMKLSEIIEGDFFNGYIKTGNILMLSQGRPGVDNIFSLSEGVLRLEVDKVTYERMGLNDTPVPSGERKHVKARYAVEINLRLPSMVRGKHGFERIVWAFKNVLNSRATWLFYDFKGSNDGTGAIAACSPIPKTCQPDAVDLPQIVVPEIPNDIATDDQETPVELLEWLSLTISQSPRVRQDDHIDAYLSRYRVPGTTDDNGRPTTQNLCKIRWRGFIPANLVQRIVIAALKGAGESWFAFSSQAFDGKTHTVLQHKHHTLTWEFEN